MPFLVPEGNKRDIAWRFNKYVFAQSEQSIPSSVSRLTPRFDLVFGVVVKPKELVALEAGEIFRFRDEGRGLAHGIRRPSSEIDRG
jgi:hypothetical protein